MINKKAVKLMNKANELEKEQEEIKSLQKLLQKRGNELLNMLGNWPVNYELAAYIEWCKLYNQFIKRTKKFDYEYSRLKYNAIQLATKGVIE